MQQVIIKEFAAKEKLKIVLFASASRPGGRKGGLGGSSARPTNFGRILSEFFRTHTAKSSPQSYDGAPHHSIGRISLLPQVNLYKLIGNKMRINEYFGELPNPDESEQQREVLLRQVDELLYEAVRQQGELARIIAHDKASSMEDANRLADQLQIIEKYSEIDRNSMSVPELKKVAEDLQRVIDNLISHKETYSE
jgi:hypothetical protein